MSEQFVDNIWLATETCCNCGMKFAMTTDFMRRKRENNALFYCPAGHGQHYAESLLSKLQHQVTQKDRELVEKNIQLCDVKTRLSSVSKAHTKMRHRVANGVCPCCNRTFQNLMQHMRTEHPDFSDTKALLALRTAFGLTQADVAKEMGISAPYVSMFERSKPVPARAERRINEWIAAHNPEPSP